MKAINATQLCSGFGQYHTDSPISPSPKPYIGITLDDLISMAKTPGSVTKENAQWVIFSDVLSRESAKQRADGMYHAVWCDFDNHTAIEEVQGVLAGLSCSHIIYSSRSSTIDKQKWRVIIQLASPANADEWQQIASVINDRFELMLIVPDRASERISQICYLPNKGDFYQFHIENTLAPLDWKTALSAELAEKQQQAQSDKERIQRIQEQSRLKAVDRLATGNLSPIDAYNGSYSIEQCLEVYGYKRIGKKWVSPNSQSRVAGVTIKADKWLSSHGSDVGIGHANSAGGVCHGDAFDLFTWYEHGGNRNAALKAAGAMFTVNGKTLSQANQQAHRGQNSTAILSAAPSLDDCPDFPPIGQEMTPDHNRPQPVLQPDPLRAPLPKSEPYPVEALGDVLGKAASALHETIKAPLALCCQSVLASASLAAQTHFDVRLPWGGKKPLSLYLLTVAESGERKSAVDDVVLGAAKTQERLEMDAYQGEQERYEADLSRWKAENEERNKTAAKAKTQEAREGVAAMDHQAQAQPKPYAPVMPLRFVTDPTVEGLYKLLAVGQPSVGLFSDEAGLLIGGHALNSDNALKTMARWCKSWDGAPFDRVRGGDGSGVLYGRRMAMHQLAQPDVMVKLLGDRMANGQGFLARCLVAWPESTIGTRHIDKFEWAGERKEVKRLFAALSELTEAEPRTGKTEQELDPVDLPLDDEATRLALAAVNQFETLMDSGNDLAELRDRASKALENACRIAGVLAVIDGGMATRSIGAKHLERGLIVIQWYLSESLRIRGAALVPQAVIDAESLSKWLQSRSMAVFRTAAVLHYGPNQLRNKIRLKEAISELVSNGYLAENEPGTVIDGVKSRSSWRVLHHVV